MESDCGDIERIVHYLTPLSSWNGVDEIKLQMESNLGKRLLPGQGDTIMLTIWTQYITA